MIPDAGQVSCVRHRRKVTVDGDRITHQGTPDPCDSERFRVTEEFDRDHLTALARAAVGKDGA